jgi:iron(III) transport system substrate-binding protein
VKANWRTGTCVLLLLALLAAACGGGDTAEVGAVDPAGDADAAEPDAAADAAAPADDEEEGTGETTAAGASDEVEEEMQRLYQAAIDAGQTQVVIYGPGEDDKLPVYELFMERFPEISVRGEYLVGPNMDSKVNAEFASGVHVASLLQSGDTSLAPKVPTDDEEGLLEPFTPISVEGIDPQFHDEEGTYAFSASASTFGILYNTNLVEADEAPQGWEELLDERWQGEMVWEDPTRFGGAFGFLNKILNDPRYDESFVERLTAQDVYLEASGPAAGNAVATGQFAIELAYPYSFYLRDIERGAPVDFVFPVEGGNHLSPHFLGLLRNAPSPDAAKLVMTWMFTDEAQQAIADVGYYPTMPGVPGPQGNPPVDELDLLDPIALPEVNAISQQNLPIVQGIWGQ